jgi:hypothetical protein
MKTLPDHETDNPLLDFPWTVIPPHLSAHGMRGGSIVRTSLISLIDYESKEVVRIYLDGDKNYPMTKEAYEEMKMLRSLDDAMDYLEALNVSLGIFSDES